MRPGHVVSAEQGKEESGIELGSGEIGIGIHGLQEDCDPAGDDGDGGFFVLGEGTPDPGVLGGMVQGEFGQAAEDLRGRKEGGEGDGGVAGREWEWVPEERDERLGGAGCADGEEVVDGVEASVASQNFEVGNGELLEADEQGTGGGVGGVEARDDGGGLGHVGVGEGLEGLGSRLG